MPLALAARLLLVTALAVVGLSSPSYADGGERGADCTIVGTRHADVLVGTKHADVICGLGGDDVIRGRGGDDVIRGGKGDDRIVPGAGADTVVCGPGRDRVRSEAGDTIAADCEAGSGVGAVPATPAPPAPPATPADVAPVAVADTATLTEDDYPTAIDVLANDTNPDGGPMTIASVSQPHDGSVEITDDGTGLTFEPDANHCGSDSFRYTLAPGGSTATVTVDVTCVDDDPVAQDDDATVLEDADATAIDVLANDGNDDGGDITIASAGPADHGTVVVDRTASGLTYQPDANFCGSDSFDYTLTPGSSSATVSVDVTCVEDSPVAAAQTTTTDEDTAVVIELSGADPDGDDLTFDVASPAQGSISVSPPTCSGTVCTASVTYTPSANYHGSESFSYTVSDGHEVSGAAAVSITINPVNDVPVATEQNVTTAEDTATGVTLAATDADGDGLHYDVATSPQHGTLSGTGSDLTYTPNANYNGPDSFTFTAGDEDATSEPATVSITVTPVNDAPVADDGAVRTAQGDAVAIDLGDDASDVETSDADLAYAVGTPLHGTISGDAPNLTYTPDSGYNGTDSFTFHVTDRGDPDNCAGALPDCAGSATTEDATITITVDKAGCFMDTTQSDFEAGTVGETCDSDLSPGDLQLDKRAFAAINTSINYYGGAAITTTSWAAQTFVPSFSGDVTDLYAGLTCPGCTGTPPALTFSLRATSGGVPSGPDLASGTVPGFTNAVASFSYQRVTLPAAVRVQAGVTYALVIRANANPSPATYYAVYSSSASAYPNGARLASSTSGASWTTPTEGTTATDFGFGVVVAKDGYPSSASYTSSTKDAAPPSGTTPRWKALSFDADVPGGTGISFQVAASNSPTGPFTFVGPDGTAGTSFGSGDDLSRFNGKRYLQYRATLTSSDPTKTPVLHSVKVCYVDSSAPLQ